MTKLKASIFTQYKYYISAKLYKLIGDEIFENVIPSSTNKRSIRKVEIIKLCIYKSTTHIYWSWSCHLIQWYGKKAEFDSQYKTYRVLEASR